MPGTTQELVNLADLFIQCEESLRDFYAACLKAYPEHQQTWASLQREEDRHANIFREIRQLVQDEPAAWSLGRFTPQTLNFVMGEVQKRTADVQKGTIKKMAALNFIVDTENSLLESGISNAFTTTSANWSEMLMRVQMETGFHRNSLKALVSTK